MKNSFVCGAIIIAVGGFLSKLLGALYRIPLTNIIGSEGIGLYQLVFPLYAMLLTISSTGIPSSLSKLISEKLATNSLYEAKLIFKKSLLLFSVLGILGSVLMAALSYPISKLQGETQNYLSYILISPSVFLVSLISCFRGYFQGRMNMLPTSISQITEQIIKLMFGLFFASLFKDNLFLAVSAICFSVTISEIFTLLFLYVLYLKNKKKQVEVIFIENYNLKEKKLLKNILYVTIPVTLSSMLIPLSQLVDSFLIVNILKRYCENSTSLYGIFSGGVMTLINLPVAVCYGLAVSILPLISKLFINGKNELAEKKVILAIKYTLYIALPAFLFYAIFPKNVVELIFNSIKAEDKIIMSNLLVISSIGIVFLSLTQTLSACLIGKNKQKIAMLSMFVGVFIKIILEILLLNNSKINIKGSAISCVACYLVATIINLVYIIKDKKNYLKILKKLIFILILSGLSILPSILILEYYSGRMFTILAGVVFIIVYFILSLISNFFDKDELKFLKRKG